MAALGDLVLLFGVVLVGFGHKFSFLYFSGETLEVGDFSGESILRETFLSITFSKQISPHKLHKKKCHI